MVPIFVLSCDCIVTRVSLSQAMALKRLGFSGIEQRNHNPRVGGSSPSSATKIP
jgi:hypothetical protein